MNARPLSESILFVHGRPTGNYARKFLKRVDADEIPFTPGAISHVVVRHDDRCPALRGSHCICDPEIEYVGGNWPPAGGERLAT